MGYYKRLKNLEYSDYSDDIETLRCLAEDLEDEIRNLEKVNHKIILPR